MLEEDIEKLIQFETYKAVCRGLGTKDSRHDQQRDPELSILTDSSKEFWDTPYFGYMVYSTNAHADKKEISNNIRQQLIDDHYSNREVYCRIISVPTENPKGPYFVVGAESLEEEEKVESIEKPVDMTPEEAFAFIKPGNNIFYAHYLFKSEQKEFEGGDPALRIWKNYEERGFGFLGTARPVRNSYRGLESRKFAERKITFEMIYGSIRRNQSPGLKKGDRLLVRKIAENPTGTTLFFEPVVNFMEEDEAYSPEGKELITIVSKDDHVYNLPILSSQKGKKPGDKWMGKAYVPHSKEESGKGRFFYKPIIVFDLSQDDCGKYVDARITKNDEKMIYAQKI